MSGSRVEPGFDQDRALPERDPPAGLTADPSRVLIVGESQINRIVVTRIVERCGLRPVTETPVKAVRVLPLMFPWLVILDGGPENHDCDLLADGIATLRGVSRNRLPATILLSNRNGVPAPPALESVIDALVAKPITTDQLQPVINRLIKLARDKDGAGRGGGPDS